LFSRLAISHLLIDLLIDVVADRSDDESTSPKQLLPSPPTNLKKLSLLDNDG